MRTWDDYKKHANTASLESAKTVEEVGRLAVIATDILPNMPNSETLDAMAEAERIKGQKRHKKADHLLFTGDRLYHDPNFLRKGGFPHRLRKCMVPPLTHFMRNWRGWLSWIPQILRKG